ncbi:MAG TPA: hypothetical protein EYQ00_09530 [Dehalococcoidia bacterium]|jgi:hypothetical protein|nr:hypothetical protein [Dehalococcoidia bacterium]
MTVGNIVTWPWNLSTGWEQTQFQGLIVSSRLVKTDREKVTLFAVLLSDGDLIEIREDVPGMELVA